MSSIKSIFRRRMIKLVSKVYDPLMDVTIGNQTIKIPFSHPLRENIIVFPNMNYNLARLAKYILDVDKNAKVIDIGANIGDTVAYIKNFADVPILCIDGDAKYISILKENVAQYKNVSVCHSMVGAETKETNLELKKERGTAFITESKEKNKISTIEDILINFPDFKSSRLIKIDTDGFDSIILKACAKYLEANKPILYFEFDPYLINVCGDDPFTLIPYLKKCGYSHLIFYMSNGDYLLSTSLDNEKLTDELVHFFSGRKVELYTDIVAFSEKDRNIYETCVKEEVKYFRKFRNY